MSARAKMAIAADGGAFNDGGDDRSSASLLQMSGAGMKFNYKNAQFDYEPYPICYIPNFLPADDYKALSESYPSLDLFRFMLNLGNKYSLAQVNNQKQYYKFLNSNQKWKEFYDTVKSKIYVDELLDFLKSRDIDLGFKDFKYISKMKKYRGLISRLADRDEIGSRFEFSVMKANGGHILPHTDGPKKYITVVLSMIQPDEWQPAWGGGTDVVLPKRREKIYNFVNKQSRFEDMEVIKTFPFVPNQAVIFIKTYNSWHSVLPMTGPESANRKTLTINIEGI